MGSVWRKTLTEFVWRTRRAVRFSRQEQLDKGGPVFLRCRLTRQDITQGQAEPGMSLSDSVKIKRGWYSEDRS